MVPPLFCGKVYSDFIKPFLNRGESDRKSENAPRDPRGTCNANRGVLVEHEAYPWDKKAGLQVKIQDSCRSWEYRAPPLRLTAFPLNEFDLQSAYEMRLDPMNLTM